MKKVLIVSYFYPPLTGMGALRVGKLVKFLPEFGYEPLVIAGGNFKNRGKNVFYPPIPDFGTIAKSFRGWYRQKIKRTDGKESTAPSDKQRVLGWWPLSGCRMPDAYLYWVLPAVLTGLYVIKHHKPAVIFSSSPPPSSAVAAAILQRLSGLPYVAEFRDLWADDPYEIRIPTIEHLDEIMEDKVLRRAAAIVATSEPAAKILYKAHGKPSFVVYNGFDEQDYPFQVRVSGVFTITFTGVIIPGKRDPRPLFQAIKLLRDQRKISPENFKVRFYGPESNKLVVEPLAQEYGVRQFCEVHDPIPHYDCLNRQCESNLLLLLEWNNPQSDISIPGKLFEYLGAGRPILCVGYLHGAQARFLEKTEMGIILNDPQKIADCLAKHLAEWRKTPTSLRNVERPAHLSQFTHRSASRQMAEIFNSVLDWTV